MYIFFNEYFLESESGRKVYKYIFRHVFEYLEQGVAPKHLYCVCFYSIQPEYPPLNLNDQPLNRECL